MPPAYVKPYVKRGKTDAADAEAICEAVARPTMRFVAVKSIDQQAALMLHKTRDLLVRQRTMLINALRGHLAEFGIISAKGPSGTKAAIETLHEAQDRLPELARRALHGLVDQLRLLGEEIDRLEARILEWHRASDQRSRRQAGHMDAPDQPSTRILLLRREGRPPHHLTASASRGGRPSRNAAGWYGWPGIRWGVDVGVHLRARRRLVDVGEQLAGERTQEAIKPVHRRGFEAAEQQRPALVQQVSDRVGAFAGPVDQLRPVPWWSDQTDEGTRDRIHDRKTMRHGFPSLVSDMNIPQRYRCNMKDMETHHAILLNNLHIKMVNWCSLQLLYGG